MSCSCVAKTKDLVVGIFLLFAVASAEAAVDTWTGAISANWNTSGNWTTTNPGGVPVSGDSIVFDGTTPNNTNNNNISGLTLTGITFNAGADPYTLNGNAVNLGWQTTGTGITHAGDILNNSSNAQIVNIGVTLDAAKHLITTGAAALNLGGPITQSKGSTAIFTNGGGGINLAGSGLANVNGILGGWATIGADWAALDGGNNVVPYAAYTDVPLGGTIADGLATNVRINDGSTTPITLAASGTTSINSLLYRLGSGTQTVTVGAGNTLVLGQNGGIYNSTALGGTFRALTISGGTLTAGPTDVGGNITFSNAALPNTSGFLTVSSNITDNGTGPVSVTVMGGNITLSSTNSHSGGTYIVSGRVSQPTGNTFGTGPVYVFPGGQFNPGGGTPITISNNLFLAGNGHTENNGLGAIRMFQNTDGNSTLMTGTVTLMADASVSSNGNNNLARTIGISGKITGSGGLMIGSPTSSANANGSGIVVVGAVSGPGTPNDFAGDTTINGTLGGGVGSTLRITNADADNIMPHGATGSFSGGLTGNVVLNATTTARKAVFDLNGSEQTINGLTNTTTSTADNFVQSSAAGGHLIFGDSDATAAFGGILQNGSGTLAVTKIGSGTQTFTGANTYSGDTRIDGGTLLTSNPYLADAADVFIGSSAFLSLDFAATDIIDALYLGGSPQPVGSYGAVGNLSAMFQTERITGTGLLEVTTLGPPLPLIGDYNGNGAVDAADYVTWRKAVTDGATMLTNRDPANEGLVGAGDYNSWRANFGKTSAGSGSVLTANQAGAVPEPGAAVLALLAVAGHVFLGRRGAARQRNHQTCRGVRA